MIHELIWKFSKSNSRPKRNSHTRNSKLGYF